MLSQELNGLILINKPAGLTSHDVVNILRKITKIKKIGHTGTLDPIATGLLILLIGKEATKQQSKFLYQNKTYWAKIKLGVTSDTYDISGKIEEKIIEKTPEFDKIEKEIKKFIGEQWQKPPLFSAKKIKGIRAYKLARQQKKITIEPQRIKIYSLGILKYQWPFLEIRTSVSSGTYIRSLANDLGQALNTGGLLYNLKREKIGQISIDQATQVDFLTTQNWLNYLVPLNKFL